MCAIKAQQRRLVNSVLVWVPRAWPGRLGQRHNALKPTLSNASTAGHVYLLNVHVMQQSQAQG